MVLLLPPPRNDSLHTNDADTIGLALTTPEARQQPQPHHQPRDRNVGPSTSTAATTSIRLYPSTTTSEPNISLGSNPSPLKQSVDDEASLSFFSQMWRSLRDEASAFLTAASGGTPLRRTTLGNVEDDEQEAVPEEHTLRSKRPRISRNEEEEEEIAEIDGRNHRHRNRPRPRGGVYSRDGTVFLARTPTERARLNDGQEATPSRHATVRFAALPSSSTKPIRPCLNVRPSPSLFRTRAPSTETIPRKERPPSPVDAILLGTIASELTRAGHQAKAQTRGVNERERIKFLEARLKALEKENEQLRKSRELSKCLADQALEMRARSKDCLERKSQRFCRNGGAGHNLGLSSPLAERGIDDLAGTSAVDSGSPAVKSSSSAALITLRQARAALKASQRRSPLQSTPGRRKHRIAALTALATPEPIYHNFAPAGPNFQSPSPATEYHTEPNSPLKMAFPQVVRSAVKRKLAHTDCSQLQPLRDRIRQFGTTIPPRSPAPSRPAIRLRPSFDDNSKAPMRPPRPAEGDLFSFDSMTTTVFGGQFSASTRRRQATALKASSDGRLEDRERLEGATAHADSADGLRRVYASVPEGPEATTSSGSQGILSTGTTSWDRIPDDRSIITCDTTPLVSRFSFSSSDVSIGTIAHAKEYRSALLYRTVEGPSYSDTHVPLTTLSTRGAHLVNSGDGSLASTVGPSATAFVLKGEASQNSSPGTDRVFRLTTLLTDEDLFTEPLRRSVP
ncbi:BQ2448_745 [Microbotryum intermedium]|uniref:BQ2448_745 protein n=1 Tax=Microbotryum intermedium TaxID=269621 RepID=A0A238F9S9_9BASI|nr:BQ2448_745 [Microbotryum intermedium]